MRAALRLTVFGLALAASASALAEGIVIDAGRLSWARFQGRIGYTAVPAWRSDLAALTGSGLKVGGASLLGDLYVRGLPKGLRATSGLLLDPRSGVTALSVGATAGPRLGIAERPLNLGEAGAESLSPLPYVGIGYSSPVPRDGGWSFSADLGLVSRNIGESGRAGRMLGGSQSLDDAVRDLRFQPVMQLGVSYSF